MWEWKGVWSPVSRTLVEDYLIKTSTLAVKLPLLGSNPDYTKLLSPRVSWITPTSQRHLCLVEFPTPQPWLWGYPWPHWAPEISSQLDWTTTQQNLRLVELPTPQPWLWGHCGWARTLTTLSSWDPESAGLHHDATAPSASGASNTAPSFITIYQQSLFCILN